jgi:hypothetical protein
VKDIAALHKEVSKALFDAVLTQTRRGGEAAKGGRFDMGAALEWSRLDFAGPSVAMEGEVYSALLGRNEPDTKRGTLLNQIADKTILAKVHAVPAAFSVPAAREPMCRPHLRDNMDESELDRAGGPIHFVACHRTVTETQATNLLGFPDATVISSPFGVYIADNVQKMQYVFLANCRDPDQTRLAVQRFWNWSEQAGESQYLADRAMARARIVMAIAQEQERSA